MIQDVKEPSWGEAVTARLERVSSPAGPDLVLWLHRGLSLAAVMGLVVNTRSFWNAHALTRPWLALLITGCYLAMLVFAVITLCAAHRRTLARLDIGVLVTAITIKSVGAWGGVAGLKKLTVDEGMLMDAAARGLADGRNPYTATWKGIEPGLPTQLMDGRTVFDFGYPPLGVEIGAVVQRIFPNLVGIVLVSWLALLATVLFIFLVAPRPLRPIATLGVLGLGTFTAYADNAYPSVIALPFLCLALWSWPSIGRDGRLGRFGLGRAAALGAACSIHQLGWFLALFLVVGLIMLRLPTLRLRGTFLLLLRYGGTALAVFALSSLPFAIKTPHAWLTGVFEPLLQHAVPHGQGLAGITHYVVGGSGGLDFYGRATQLLLAALLVTFALFLRRIGPAIAVLPWVIFMVSTRSQDGYWLLTMPLWLVALVTTSRADFADAYQLRLPSSVRARAAVTAALFLPAAACFVIAVATPQPLTFRVQTPVVAGETLNALTVDVTNRSSAPVTPHFSVVTGVTIADFWKIQTGPETLPAGETATYTLAPSKKDKAVKIPPVEPAFLRVVSDEPQTLSSTRLTR
ncbi:hypothetical protein FHR83_001673 [Actinoplanes campanulatus]|uniref:Uncharacterized protein n=1 Tax=Actinoplanes campanulatus TaxID=113559 RepID=A0A7W5ADL6_9ACTN|nr:hypothetical protein [Actinoplanes campanulatus]MBB3094024.1 hypothetical protein [Actinoplanes campanulatus]GGN33235.1 hypothetical protein GCM10010109_55050 [Actinoplanes campanulatus]GID38280.1 hypothetical protein Aca09nite_47860 [Actinoplanes campanulatus]